MSGDGESDQALSGPGVSLLRSLDELPVEEAAHLEGRGRRQRQQVAAGGGGPGSSGNSSGSGNSSAGPAAATATATNGAGFSLRVGALKEGTVTVELALAHALLQWPYLSDLSLVSAVINTFYADWGAPPRLPPAWLQLRRSAWLYFNLVLTESQVFIPLLSPHLDATSNADGKQSTGHQQQRSQQQGTQAPPRSPFEVLRDVVLRQASGVTADDVERGRAQPLEQQGVVATFGALRFGYSYGGDGEAVTRADVRNLAGFVRHRGAVITTWLLPLSDGRLELRTRCPLVAEHTMLLPLLMCTRRLAYAWRVRQRQRAAMSSTADVSSGAAAGGSAAVAGTAAAHEGGGRCGDARSASHAASGARGAGGVAATPEQRLLALACHHAEELLGERLAPGWHPSSGGIIPTLSTQVAAERGAAAGGAAATGMCGVVKLPSRSELSLELSPLTLRAAFSNIEMWRLLQADMELANQAIAGGGVGAWPPRPDVLPSALAARAAGLAWPPPPQGWAAAYRPSSLRLVAALECVTLLLCDDRPASFGAPDVLQAAARRVALLAASDARTARVPAERAARLHLEGGLSANVLNSSNSRWETLLEPWPLLADASTPINPLARSDRTM